MTVTASSTVTSAMLNAIGWSVLGGIAVFTLIVALVAKEIAAHSGNERLLPLHRALTIAVVPLTMVVAIVLVQQYTRLA